MKLSDSPTVKHAMDSRRTLGALAASGILLALAGAVTIWSPGDGVTLTGIRGQHNGWLVIALALVASVFLRSLISLNWSAIAATALAAAFIAYLVVGSTMPPGTSFGIGYWLSLSGGLLLLVASLAAVILRKAARFYGPRAPLIDGSYPMPQPTRVR